MKPRQEPQTVDPERGATYELNWPSLQRHGVPDWLRDAKFGIYYHWGPYAVQATFAEWYTHFMYQPGTQHHAHHLATYGDLATFGYKDFIPMFTGEHFDADDWADIRVNACWEAQAPGKKWKETHGQDYDGIAWYRTRFRLRPDEVGKDILLTFGAVDEACVVYVNGDKVHTRIFDRVNNPGGWNQPFTVDISRAVNREGENTLAVRVEDQKFAGGVWKPVSLTGQERAVAR